MAACVSITGDGRRHDQGGVLLHRRQGRLRRAPVFGDQRPGHGDLIAMGESGAMGAILPDLVGQRLPVDHFKPVAAEEAGLVGQGEDPGDAQFLRLRDQFVDDAPAGAAALASSPDGKGPDLGQVVPHDHEGSAADHLAAALGDNEIPDVLEEAVDRHRKEYVLLDVGLEDLHDLGDVPDHGRPDGGFYAIRIRCCGRIHCFHSRPVPFPAGLTHTSKPHPLNHIL